MPSSWRKTSFLPVDLIVPDDLQPLVDVAGDFEALANDIGIELGAREDLRIGLEPNGGSGAAGGAELFQLAGCLALAELHLPFGAIAPDRGDELLGERIDDRRADAMQAAAGFVVAGLAVIEFSAGVERAEDDLDRRLLMRRMIVDGDAAAIIADGDARAVLVQRDFDLVGVAVHGLVDGVVEDFPDQVMQPRRPGAADVHARALPHGVEAFENGNAAGVVGGGGGHVISCFVCVVRISR